MARPSILAHAFIVGAFSLFLAPTVSAQGFGVYEQGACTMATAGAGVASPCDDGSALFFNPAAIAMQSRTISLGATLISPRGGFEDSTTGQVSDLLDRNYPVPAVYLTQPIGQRLAVGISLNAPYGLSTEWDQNTSQGRFLGYKSKVEGIYVQPTVAFRANDKVAIGFGLDITNTRVELRQRVDLSRQTLVPGVTFAAIGVPRNTDFADVRLKGDSTQVGFHLGALLKATEKVSVGARYMSRQKASIDNGEITTQQLTTGLRLPITLSPTLPAGTPIDAIVAGQFASGARLGPQSGTTALYLPDQFVVGVAVQATEKVKVLADYQFVNWSLFDELDIVGSAGLSSTVVEAYENTSGIRLGVDIAATDRFSVRGGLLAHGAAAPDQTVTPNLPEGKRQEYTIGFGAHLTRNVRFDFAYQRLQQSDRDGRTSDCGVEAPTVACNNGVYKFHANLLGAGLVFKF